MKFEELNLSDQVNKSIKNMGFNKLTEVQEAIIPTILQGKDVVVQAKTGSGKTAAFAIPIVDKVPEIVQGPKCLVVTPTRELAVQVSEEIGLLGRHKKIRSLVVYGKQSIDKQINQLKQRVHIVVGTPGRINDLIRRKALITEVIEYFVLDEGDELLRRGFLEDINAMFEAIPKGRQILLFSATVPKEIKEICDGYMNKPKWLFIEEEPPLIDEIMYELEEEDKLKTLLAILKKENPFTCLVFVNTQQGVDKLVSRMSLAGVKALKLHGGMNQRDRLRSIDSFKNGDVMCLATTDLAARGIHIDRLDLVVNYELPDIVENYVHRIGRTGRAGETGTAYSLITDKQVLVLRNIEKLRGKSFKLLKFQEDKLNIKQKDINQQKNREKIKIDRNKHTKTVDNDIMKIRVGIGKQKKVRASDFVGAISRIEGMSASDIGVIEIRDTCSYIDIHNFKGNMVLKSLTRVKGKNVKVVKIKKLR